MPRLRSCVSIIFTLACQSRPDLFFSLDFFFNCMVLQQFCFLANQSRSMLVAWLFCSNSVSDKRDECYLCDAAQSLGLCVLLDIQYSRILRSLQVFESLGKMICHLQGLESLCKIIQMRSLKVCEFETFSVDLTSH